MKYIIIKYFPSNKIDYLSYFFFNFFFSLIFIVNIPYLNSFLFDSDKSSYTLLIPKVDQSFEENKDLIFSQLSINDRIISVNKVEKNLILKELNKKLDVGLIPDELIPEAFEIIIKKNNFLDIKKENLKIKEIIKDAEIIETTKKDYKEGIKGFLIIISSIIFFLIFLAILQINCIKNIKPFLIKSRIFGAKDRDIIFNISLGYSLLQFLGVLFGYSLIYLLDSKYKALSLVLFKNIEAIVIFILMQNIICVLSLGYNLNRKLRKVL